MKSVPRPSWSEYQALAAAAFADMGCSVAIDGALRGARAVHRVDVLVRFSKWGINHLWIVECKHQKRRVTKSAVETLKSIVLDTGADRGLLLSEAGFQPAALAAATKTSLSLLTLAELRSQAAPDLQLHLLDQLERRAIAWSATARDLHLSEDYGANGTCYRLRPGVEVKGGEVALGVIVCLTSAIRESKIGVFKSALPDSFPPNERRYVRIHDLTALLEEGFRLLAEMDSWLAAQWSRRVKAERRLTRLGVVFFNNPSLNAA